MFLGNVDYLIAALKQTYLMVSHIASIPLSFINEHYNECIIGMLVGLLSSYTLTTYVNKGYKKGMILRFLIILLPILIIGILMNPKNNTYSRFQNLCDQYRDEYCMNKEEIETIKKQIKASEKAMNYAQKEVNKAKIKHGKTNYNIDWIQYQYYEAFLHAVTSEKARLDKQYNQLLLQRNDIYYKLGIEILIE